MGQTGLKWIWLSALLAVSAGALRAAPAYPPGEADRQWAVLAHDLQKRTAFVARAEQVLRPEALVLAADRDPVDIVLRRTAALLADLRKMPEAPDLAAAGQELDALKTEAQTTPTNHVAARRGLFERALALRRRVAFANPLLDFTELVFIKRHRAVFGHMCDQFYGIAARPGGGVFVLSNAFGAKPVARDVLATATVSNGRLQGRRLEGGPNRWWKISYDGVGRLQGEATQGGSFLSPDLSFDGRALLFAYVECQGDRTHRSHTDPARGHWAEGRCYHIFKVNMDGTGLTQLTDGTWNDFDPCWLPNGRVAFISERRGGYLRCGRICPTYTLHDMAADGSDIRCLSFHETNEWQPSVTPEGLIIYTRWDYVDRGSMVAHGPWIITPDGRDPRAVRGNYTLRHTRPDMELDLRAIPGSHRYVATAAPHHGQANGSLVVFDPRVEDDNRMSAVKRLTPDVGFPESQQGTEAYGEPWPLSEDYYLCSYDPAMETPGLGKKGFYGLYLLDSFGNKELIYRDPEIGAHNPIPLRPRPMPPVVSENGSRVAAPASAEAVVGVVNVYASVKPWPKDIRITALRVCQVLPLSVGSDEAAQNTGLQIPGSASINLARAVLGTAPVEADGSARFIVPARKELYFQALDERGLAVTTMRSGTHFQPGETALCQGCHEPRRGAPPAPAQPPLAMRRAPSRLQPEVDGTNPFSYPRLVQPVLDQHCVACHARPDAKAPPLDAKLVTRPSGGFMDKPTTYYASYLSLTPKFGFYDYGKDPESTPGKIGARGSALFQLLEKGHYDVKLPPEDLHRITLWLDLCSIFYGVYEKDGAAEQLRGGVARPTLE